jgi:hypothetical protein
MTITVRAVAIALVAVAVAAAGASGCSGAAGGGTVSRPSAGRDSQAASLAPTGSPAPAGGYIYWANNASDSIGRANLDGSDASQAFLGEFTSASG